MSIEGFYLKNSENLRTCDMSFKIDTYIQSFRMTSLIQPFPLQVSDQQIYFKLHCSSGQTNLTFTKIAYFFLFWTCQPYLCKNVSLSLSLVQVL